MDLEYTLAEAGAVVAGLRRTLEDAMARANVGDFAVAVLDFSLGSETVAHRLVRRGIPFVLCTGQSGRDPSLTEWACPIVEKPASPDALVPALTSVLSSRSSRTEARR